MAVVDDLTGMHNVIVQCLFVDNRRCKHGVFWLSLQVKSKWFKSGESGVLPYQAINWTVLGTHCAAPWSWSNKSCLDRLSNILCLLMPLVHTDQLKRSCIRTLSCIERE
jgi:hypothetical protein